MGRTFSEFSKAFVVRRVLNYMDSNPDENIPKILNWKEKHDKGGTVTNQVHAVRDALNDPYSNWSRLTRSLWRDIDKGVRRTLFENFVINASMIGTPRQLKAIEFLKAHGFITNKYYSQMNKISERQALRELNEMVDANVLNRMGKGRACRYLLVNDSIYDSGLEE